MRVSSKNNISRDIKKLYIWILIMIKQNCQMNLNCIWWRMFESWQFLIKKSGRFIMGDKFEAFNVEWVFSEVVTQFLLWPLFTYRHVFICLLFAIMFMSNYPLEFPWDLSGLCHCWLHWVIYRNVCPIRLGITEYISYKVSNKIEKQANERHYKKSVSDTNKRKI